MAMGDQAYELAMIDWSCSIFRSMSATIVICVRLRSQVVILPMNLEVNIPRQAVGQEPDAIFENHQLGSEDEMLYLDRVEKISG